MYCKNCGKKIYESSVFCKYCGEKTIKPKKADNLVNSNNKYIDQKSKKISDIDKNSPIYKKIYNTGTSAIALGWINLILNLFLIFGNSAELESGYFIINLIYVLAISYVFIKYGNRIKKVNQASLSDVMILLWTSVVILTINLLAKQGVGILFLVEFYYLFQTKAILKVKENYKSKTKNNPIKTIVGIIVAILVIIVFREFQYSVLVKNNFIKGCTSNNGEITSCTCAWNAVHSTYSMSEYSTMENEMKETGQMPSKITETVNQLCY